MNKAARLASLGCARLAWWRPDPAVGNGRSTEHADPDAAYETAARRPGTGKDAT